jgi:hypothetical protein
MAATDASDKRILRMVEPRYGTEWSWVTEDTHAHGAPDFRGELVSIPANGRLEKSSDELDRKPLLRVAGKLTVRLAGNA